MKKLMNGILLSAAVAMGAVLSSSGDAAANEGKGYSVDQKMEMLTDELSLTPDQQTSIRAILEDKKARKQAAVSVEERDAVAMEARGRIRALLTEEQRTKYDAMKKDMHGSKTKNP